MTTFARAALVGSLVAALVPSGSFAAAQPASDSYSGNPQVLRYPATTSLDFGQTKLFMQADRESVLAGVQFFVPAGLGLETATDNGIATLTAECVMRTQVNTPSG